MFQKIQALDSIASFVIETPVLSILRSLKMHYCTNKLPNSTYFTVGNNKISFLYYTANVKYTLLLFNYISIPIFASSTLFRSAGDHEAISFDVSKTRTGSKNGLDCAWAVLHNAVFKECKITSGDDR